MYQAGVKNITLYENNGIDFWYWDSLDLKEITGLTSIGATIPIISEMLPEYEIDIKSSDSGKIVMDYTLKFYLLGFFDATLDIINQLRASIYGWCFLVEFYDGTFKYYHTPVKCIDSKIKPHKEMSFEVEMKTVTPTTLSHFNYTPGISTVPVFRADTTLLTADTTIYTADYAL
jgi:hypothetical protein